MTTNTDTTENETILQKRPKHRGTIVVLVVAFVVAAILVGAGLYFVKSQERQNEMRTYESAMKSTEPLVLQNFLDMYADAPMAHRDSVKAYLQVLRKVDTDWTDALVNNSRYAYELFLKMHPQSIYTIEAGIKIDSLDWLTAKNDSTVEALKGYLARHDDGAYYDEACLMIEELEARLKAAAADSLQAAVDAVDTLQVDQAQ